MSIISIDNEKIANSEVLQILRKTGQIPMLVKNLILEKELSKIHLGAELENQLIDDFRKERKLLDDESFLDYMASRHLDEELLKQMLSRPELIIRYREERWGPRSQSLYLKHKDRYDLVNYRRLQCKSADVMQEVFFRLKGKEESWESLSKQFHPNDPGKSRIGPVPVSSMEPSLLEALRSAGEGRIVRPLKLGDKVVVAELESFQASRFDDELRQRILQQEFENWLEEESTKMLSKTSFPT